MKDIRILANHISHSVFLDYVDRNRILSRKHLLIKRVEEGFTDGGKYRIWIYANDQDQNTNVQKSYLAHRIISFIDEETGECVEDTKSYFRNLLQIIGGKCPSDWPEPDDNRLRIRNFNLEFDQNNFLKNWSFGVHKAFRPALDILWTQGKSNDGSTEHFWTRGKPPQYAFDMGDIFYRPAIANKTWSDQLGTLGSSLQVIGFDKKNDLGERLLIIEKQEFQNGKKQKCEELVLSQAEFAQILELGFDK